MGHRRALKVMYNSSESCRRTLCTTRGRGSVVCTRRTDAHGTGRALLRLRLCYAIGLLLLIAQFLLGMAVNIWVTIPAHHIGTGARNYFVGLILGVGYASAQAPAIVQLHVAVAVLLLAQAITAAIWSTRSHDARLTVCAWFSLFGIIGAGFNGGNFVNGLHPNLSSYLMSVAFALTAVSEALAWGRVQFLLGAASQTTCAASDKGRH